MLTVRLGDGVDPARVEAVLAASRESLKAAPPVAVPPKLTLDALVDCGIEALRVIAVEATASGKPGYVRLRLEGDQSASCTVVAHIGDPADFVYLVGERLLVLANLVPKKLQGEESQGMILAAEVGEGVIPVSIQFF